MKPAFLGHLFTTTTPKFSPWKTVQPSRFLSSLHFSAALLPSRFLSSFHSGAALLPSRHRRTLIYLHQVEKMAERLRWFDLSKTRRIATYQVSSCSPTDDPRRVEEAEGRIDRDVSTYAIEIDQLFKKHRNEEALRHWYKMIDEGIAPTPAAFRVLSTGLCLSGKVDRAWKILDEMAPMGVVPETAHQDMINVLCKAGRVKLACKLADEIVDKEREVPGKVRTMFINALRKAGRVELALKMLHSKIGIGYDRTGSIKRRVRFRTLLSC